MDCICKISHFLGCVMFGGHVGGAGEGEGVVPTFRPWHGSCRSDPRCSAGRRSGGKV